MDEYNVFLLHKEGPKTKDQTQSYKKKEKAKLQRLKSRPRKGEHSQQARPEEAGYWRRLPC